MRRAKGRRRLTAPSFLTTRGDNAAKPPRPRRLYRRLCGAPEEIVMVRLTLRLLLACFGLLLPLAGNAAGLSIYLRNYYTEYQVVKDCIDRGLLHAARCLDQ